MSLTQTGPGVGQTGSSSLSAGFFVQQTLVGIRLAHNAAHWRPLPDFRGQCPHAEECADKSNSAGLNEVLLFKKKKKKITNTETFFFIPWTGLRTHTFWDQVSFFLNHLAPRSNWKTAF